MLFRFAISALSIICAVSFTAQVVEASSLTSEATVTTLPGGTSEPSHQQYELALIELALSKTENEYGPYVLNSTPQMNTARTVESMKTEKFENYIRALSYKPKLADENDLIFFKFPIYRGIASYQTCFTPERSRRHDKVSEKTLNEIKRFSFGVEFDWSDTEIFEHNDFKKIVKVSDYQSLFKMTAAGRIDFLCRGTNVVLSEYKKFKNMKGLKYDKYFAFHISNPHFFYTHKNNKEALKRIQKGISIAVEDGSMEALWKHYFKESLEFAQLHERRIFSLDNPYSIPNIADDSFYPSDDSSLVSN